MKKRDIKITDAAIDKIKEILKSENDAVLRLNHRTNTVDVIEQRIKVIHKIPAAEIKTE